MTPLPGRIPLKIYPRKLSMYLLGSRYCETDTLSQTAWQLFGHIMPGYRRVQAICDFVHNHIWFNYQNACSTQDRIRGV